MQDCIETSITLQYHYTPNSNFFFLMNFMLNFKHNGMNPKHYGLSLRDLRNSIVAKFEEYLLSLSLSTSI